MTLFGYNLDGQQITALVSLLAVLALWLVVLGRERGYARWFRQWEADRKNRHDAEADRDGRKRGHKAGPWG